MTYKNRIKALACAAVILLSACNGGGNKTSDRTTTSEEPAENTTSTCSYQGVSFYYPGTWKVETDELEKDLAYYIGCEEKGFSSSGLISVTIIQSELDINDMLERNVENLKAQRSHKNIITEPVEATKFGGYDAVMCDFTVRIMNVDFWGKIYTFNAHGKTISIILQDEKSTTESVFDFFVKSFKVE